MTCCPLSDCKVRPQFSPCFLPSWTPLLVCQDDFKRRLPMKCEILLVVLFRVLSSRFPYTLTRNAHIVQNVQRSQLTCCPLTPPLLAVVQSQALTCVHFCPSSMSFRSPPLPRERLPVHILRSHDMLATAPSLR